MINLLDPNNQYHTDQYTATFESGDKVSFYVTGIESITRRLNELESSNDFGCVVKIKRKKIRKTKS